MCNRPKQFALTKDVFEKENNEECKRELIQLAGASTTQNATATSKYAVNLLINLLLRNDSISAVNRRLALRLLTEASINNPSLLSIGK